jgi:hypothetical protein
MKRCEISISSAHECLRPCGQQAVDFIPLGDNSCLYLCKEHYESFGKLHNNHKGEESYLGTDI